MGTRLEAVPSVGSLVDVSLAEVLGDLRTRGFDGSLVLTDHEGAEHTIVLEAGDATKAKTPVAAPPPKTTGGDPEPPVTDEPESALQRALLALVASLSDRGEYVRYPDLDLLGSDPGVSCGVVPAERLIWAAVRAQGAKSIERRLAWFKGRPLHVDPDVDIARWHMGKPGRAIVEALRERAATLEELEGRPELLGKKVGQIVLALSIGGVVATDAAAFLTLGVGTIHGTDGAKGDPRVVGSDPAGTPRTPEAWIRAHFGAPESLPQDIPPPPEKTPKQLYVLFGLALLPLLATLGESADDVGRRLNQTMSSHPELGELWSTGTKDQILAALPEHQLAGAWLPTDTFMHWIYALVAALVMLTAALGLFERGHARVKHLALTTAFTATCGIGLLLLFQLVAGATQGLWLRGGNIIVLLFYVVKFIGFSYSAAMDPENGFVLSMLGFTCGVGLCEELTKALPLLWHFRRSWRTRPPLDWRAARLWMVASGIGFGAAEGVMYSSDYYNGIHGPGIYVVRFVSCVALHAVWSASVGIAIYLRRLDLYGRQRHWAELAIAILRALVVPMVLHGLYDTLLKKEMGALALAVAAASFGWLIWQVEKARAAERPADLPAPAAVA